MCLRVPLGVLAAGAEDGSGGKVVDSMRVRARIASLGIIMTIVACQSASAQSPERRTITVDGQAEVRVVPNEVVLTVGVETFDSDLATAKADNDDRLRALLHVTESLGIARRDVRTDYLSIQPEFKDRNDRGNFLRYVVRKTVVISLRDISKFEELLSSLLEAGVNYVHGVDFRTTELSQHRDEAQARAIAAARHKAEVIADGLGQKIGQPQNLRVMDSHWQSSYSRWGASQRREMTNVVVERGSNDGALEGPTAPGQIAVSARVTISFELME